MGRITHINTLRKHLEYAKERLSLEKVTIQSLYPLSDGFSREEYAFNYVRAERLGLKAINRRLSEIAWLPMQLDPTEEILGDNRSAMRRWITAPIHRKPEGDDFGNDFIHALTRCSLADGIDSPNFSTLSHRVANLFRDLSCLIGVIYYCTWLTEHGIEELSLSDPGNLNRTAEEIAAMLQSPDIFSKIRVREQTNDAVPEKKAAKPKKSRPQLRVIKNDNYQDADFTGPFIPDPAGV